jgi:AraC-like DNA-binding protein
MCLARWFLAICMKQARQALEIDNLTVGEVSCMVGYTNLPAFRRALNKKFVISPGNYLPRNPV